MTKTVFVDDSESLVEAVKVFVADNRIGDTICLTSVEDAEKVIRDVKDVKRIIADLVFEGSGKDGIDLLETARKRDPGAECILLTGFTLNPTQSGRLFNS